MVLEKLYTCMYKDEVRPLSLSLQKKISCEWIKGLNVKLETAVKR